MIAVNPWTAETFAALYRLFENDFKNRPLDYRGYNVWFFPNVHDGKEEIFWHLTHRKDRATGTYLPDLRRSERLPWAGPLIQHPDEAEVRAWDFKEHDGKIVTYIWLRDHDYLVLMKKYKDGQRRLMTAHYLDYEHKKRKLAKKYAKRIA